MKIRIDDVRLPPDSTWEFSFRDTLKENSLDFAVKRYFKDLILYIEQITEISFDHDLWDENEITWYELLRITLDIYKACKIKLPKISIHSANPVWVDRMKSLLNYYSI